MFSLGSSYCKQNFIYHLGCLGLVARYVIYFRDYKEICLRDQEFILTVWEEKYLSYLPKIPILMLFNQRFSNCFGSTLHIE